MNLKLFVLAMCVPLLDHIWSEYLCMTATVQTIWVFIQDNCQYGALTALRRVFAAGAG